MVGFRFFLLFANVVAESFFFPLFSSSFVVVVGVDILPFVFWLVVGAAANVGLFCFS